MNEKAKEAMDGVLAAFQDGKLAEAAAHTYLRRLAGDGVPYDKWSLANQIITVLRGTDDARGFRQWQRVGRFVKRGAKAFYILGPRIVKEKDATTGKENSKLIGFVGIPVFRHADTDGQALERPNYTPPTPPPLLDVAKRLGVSVDYAAFRGAYLGAFCASASSILLCTHDEEVFFHELAHAAHSSIDKKQTGGQDEKRETVAEFTACIIARMFGKDTTKSSHQYIAQYKGDPARAVLSVLGTVEKVLNVIFLPETGEEVSAN